MERSVDKGKKIIYHKCENCTGKDAFFKGIVVAFPRAFPLKRWMIDENRRGEV